MEFHTNLQDAKEVADLFHRSAEATLSADCRRGCADRIAARGRLLATGDIHDNPVHLGRILTLAELEADPDHHVTFHEVIHGDNLIGDMDFSYRMLARIAELKLRFPEQVHALLGNHELSQIVGAGVLKHGINCVEAFNEAVEFTFQDEAERVREAIECFIRSMTLALICDNGVLCAHSLPGPHDLAEFDLDVLDRDLEEADFVRHGSAHRLVWGRRLSSEHLEALAERWGVRLFVLGHMLAEMGWQILPPNAIVLNSDHERGCVLPLDLAVAEPISDLQSRICPLAAVET
ncbi:MAG: metallophosphoesterase [Phycisphaerales bacterium JB038]